jgi:hypothetical protein
MYSFSANVQIGLAAVNAFVIVFPDASVAVFLSQPGGGLTSFYRAAGVAAVASFLSAAFTVVLFMAKLNEWPLMHKHLNIDAACFSWNAAITLILIVLRCLRPPFLRKRPAQNPFVGYWVVNSSLETLAAYFFWMNQQDLFLLFHTLSVRLYIVHTLSIGWHASSD